MYTTNKHPLPETTPDGCSLTHPGWQTCRFPFNFRFGAKREGHPCKGGKVYITRTKCATTLCSCRMPYGVWEGTKWNGVWRQVSRNFKIPREQLLLFLLDAGRGTGRRLSGFSYFSTLWRSNTFWRRIMTKKGTSSYVDVGLCHLHFTLEGVPRDRAYDTEVPKVYFEVIGRVFHTYHSRWNVCCLQEAGEILGHDFYLQFHL